jgi:hypothetical protein
MVFDAAGSPSSILENIQNWAQVGRAVASLVAPTSQWIVRPQPVSDNGLPFVTDGYMTVLDLLESTSKRWIQVIQFDESTNFSGCFEDARLFGDPTNEANQYFFLQIKCDTTSHAVARAVASMAKFIVDN